MRLLLLTAALGSALVAVATLVYVRRPSPEPDDWRWTRSNATGLYPGPV